MAMVAKRHTGGPAVAAAAGDPPDEEAEERLVIRLPDPRVLRVVARSVLLAVALLSLPWLRAALLAAAETSVSGTARRPAACAPDFALQTQMLLHDLRREGLLNSGGRAIFLGGCAGRLPALKRNNVQPISRQWMPMVGDVSVDFILDSGHFGEDEDKFGFVDRVLKIGGIVAAPVGPDDTARPFCLPQNYRLVYIRRFGETFVAIKKTAHASKDSNAGNGWPTVIRRALAAPEAKKEVLLDPLAEHGNFKKLPSMRSPSDIGTPKGHGSRKWFEMIRLDLAAIKTKMVNARGMSDWLPRTAKEEDYMMTEGQGQGCG